MSILTKSSVQRITPLMAAAWLDRNPNNRAITNARVEAFARMMKDGEWKMNGESIIIDRAGYLLDGQHRLAAVCMSGCTIESIVVEGVERSAFTTIDRGFGRSFADVLSIEKEEDHRVLAATVREYMTYLVGRPHVSQMGGQMPTIAELKHVLIENPELRRSVRIIREAGLYAGGSSNGLMSASMAACLHYVFWKISPAQADAFMSALVSGANLEPNSPAWVARERLRQAQTNQWKRLRRRQIAAIVTKAWNLTREGRTVDRIIFRGGERSEEFPNAL